MARSEQIASGIVRQPTVVSFSVRTEQKIGDFIYIAGLNGCSLPG